MKKRCIKNLKTTGITLFFAILAQKVERNYIGVSGGIMDQMVDSNAWLIIIIY